jgi:hypothetical protein
MRNLLPLLVIAYDRTQQRERGREADTHLRERESQRPWQPFYPWLNLQARRFQKSRNTERARGEQEEQKHWNGSISFLGFWRVFMMLWMLEERDVRLFVCAEPELLWKSTTVCMLTWVEYE